MFVSWSCKNTGLHDDMALWVEVLVSHQPAKLCGNTHFCSRDIMVLFCHVILKDEVMDGIPSW